jgi:eukaryotic-like serine/threonine-protein kinase
VERIPEVLGARDELDEGDLDAQLVLRRARAALFGAGAPPLRLGRYELRERIGAGGLGVVYAAFDPELERTIAVKLVRPDQAFGEDAAAAQARLLREAQSMAKLSHHHVIHVYDVGTWGDAVWVAMEFVEGSSLREWLAATRRSTREILDVLIAAGRGLAAAHAAGLVHRDFKPDNVLVDTRGRAYVLDFGLARAVELDDRDSAVTLADALGGGDDRATLTRSGALVGTPAYMAPEQFRGGNVTAATDQFGFCATAWEALLGERPFAGTTIPEIMMRVCAGERRAIPRGRRLPARVRRALERGLAIDPDARHPTMDVLLEQLGGSRTRAVTIAAVVAAGLAGGAVAAFASLHDAAQCSGASRPIEATWNPARAEQLHAQLRAAELPWAEQSASAVVRTLDEAASRWAISAEQSCESHRRGERSSALFDAQTACLDVARRSLDATAGALLVLDRERLGEALAIAQQVRDPGRCDEARVVGPWLEAPADPQVAAEVIARHGELAEISARAAVEGYAVAASEAETVLARADALGHAPLQAEAALVVGDLWERAGDRDAATRRLQAALWTAQASSNLDVVVRAAIQLVYLDGVVRGELERASVWRELGTASLAARGDEAALAGGLANAWAGALFDAGRYAEAARGFAEVLERYASAFGEHDIRLVAPLNNLAVAQIQLAAFDDADAHLDRAGHIVADTMGPLHPDLAGVLHSRGELAWMRGDAAAAEPLFRRALEIRSAGLGAEHSSTLSSEVNLGSVLASLARPDEAAVPLAHALAAARRHDDTQVMLAALEALGNVQADRQRFAEALALHREVLAARERLHGPTHRDVGTALGNVAADLVDLGRDDEAERALDRQIEILELALGSDHPSLRDPLRRRAELRARREASDR